MDFTEREKFLLAVAISEYMSRIRETSYCLKGLGIKYHKKKRDDVLIELSQLRDKITNGEWEQYIKDYIEG